MAAIQVLMVVVLAALSLAPAAAARRATDHCDYVSTGLPYTVVVSNATKNGAALSAGEDVIGAFDTYAGQWICVGSQAFEGSWPMVISPQQADPGNSLPGFTAGHAIVLELCRSVGDTLCAIPAPTWNTGGHYGDGGFSQTDEVTFVYCTPPEGACCQPDGSCSVTLEADCAEPDVWQGAETTCAPNPCPQPEGACCQPDGTCSVTAEADCAEPDVWQGAATTCTPNPCSQPQGACCQPDGTCSVTAEADCAEPDVWQGAGTTCTPNPCPQPEGACCHPDDSCTVTTQADCIDAWMGAGTACDAEICSTPIERVTWGRIKQTYR
jgi:hypothetical protein